MRRTAVRMLVTGLALLFIIALAAPRSQASASPAVQQQSIVTMAYMTDNPPTSDCIIMIGFILAGVSIKAGAAAYVVGAGAVSGNASALLNDIFAIDSTHKCLDYLVPAYINQICAQSHKSLFSYKTWEARALVAFATKGRHTVC